MWAPSRISPSGFGEMASWLDRRARVLEGLAAVRDAEHAVEDLATRASSLRDRLVAALEATGAPRPEPATLAEVVRAAEARREHVERERRAAQEAADAVATLTATVEERRAALAEDERSLATTNEDLARLVAPLGVAGDASADEIEAILRAVGELAALEEKKASAESRMGRLAAETRAFEELVSTLVGELAPSLGELRTEDAAEARRARAEGRALDLRATRRRSAPRGAGPCAASGRSRGHRRASGGVRAEARRSRGIARGLRSRDRRAPAALGWPPRRARRRPRPVRVPRNATLQAQEALAKVRAHVERYARAKLASTLLTREIARFREEHQGPLLATTSKIFHRLTRGAFLGVRAGFDDKDRPSLVCVRDAGDEVDVNGLSEGTRDQLYLALRLSTLLRNAEIRGPLPFVLDDLFVNFDDERAKAGLSVLVEVAETMQVLFFTHHAHLVELARRTVPDDSLHVHVLRRARRSAPGLTPRRRTPEDEARHEAPASASRAVS